MTTGTRSPYSARNSASVSTSDKRVALSKFTFEMGDTQHLDHVLAAVRRIEGVFDVYRVTSGVQRDVVEG